MKLLFVWTGITRCAGDCWRALQALPGVELKIVLDAARNPDLEKEILHGLDYEIADGEGWRWSAEGSFRPDVLLVVGWRSKVVRAFAERPDWRDVPKVLCFDMPWRNVPRCWAARFVLWSYLRRFRAAYVPGASGERYARWLGFRRIHRGFLSMDIGRFTPSEPLSDRKGFVYVGRAASEKRLDLLERAYARYRALGGTWEIDYHHRTAYSDLPRVYAEHACLLLASAFDPWPLVALEAKAAGCEVVMSDRCGNRLELEARVVKFGDVEAMAREMLAVERAGRLPARQDLGFWNCREWAARTLRICKEMT